MGLRSDDEGYGFDPYEVVNERDNAKAALAVMTAERDRLLSELEALRAVEAAGRP